MRPLSFSLHCVFLRVSCFMMPLPYIVFFFFFNDTATTEIYTLSLHDALPISTVGASVTTRVSKKPIVTSAMELTSKSPYILRSEEHTSELQSPCNLVCRLLLEKKKKQNSYKITNILVPKLNEITTRIRMSAGC